jgi:sec-independent protein translocase protein TatA
MPHIGMPELIIILVVVVLLFGASRLPELARSVGVSMKEFKKATREAQEDEKDTKQA